MKRRLSYLYIAAIMCFFLGEPAVVEATSPKTLVCSPPSNQVFIINTKKAVPIGSPIRVGVEPARVAITRDAKRAWVCQLGHDISIIDTASNKRVGTIPIAGKLAGIAITPNNKQAWVSVYSDNKVELFDVVSRSLLRSIPVGQRPTGIAITPDNAQVWVCNSSDKTVSVIDIASKTVSATIHVGTNPFAIAITPDNRQAWVCNAADNTVSIIDIVSKAVSDTLSVGTNPAAIAITPDNTQAWVCNAADNTVSIIDIASKSVSATILVGTYPDGIAITPDNRRVWVCNHDDSTISVIHRTSPTRQNIVSLTTGFGPFGIAITPDQAPRARFSVKKAGTTTVFNASKSTSPFKRIASYTWNFGDGSPQVTVTTPKISHKYAQSGTYKVTLRVTNTSGTSTKRTFTGQTVSNNGEPSAKRSRQIKVSFAH